jgi:hypothetical protein
MRIDVRDSHHIQLGCANLLDDCYGSVCLTRVPELMCRDEPDLAAAEFIELFLLDCVSHDPFLAMVAVPLFRVE